MKWNFCSAGLENLVVFAIIKMVVIKELQKYSVAEVVTNWSLRYCRQIVNFEVVVETKLLLSFIQRGHLL